MALHKVLLPFSLASLLSGIGLQSAPPDHVMNGEAEGRSRAVLAQLMAQGDLLETAATARIEGGALQWDFRGRAIVWPLVGRVDEPPVLRVDEHRFELPRTLFARLLTQTLQVQPIRDARLQALVLMRSMKVLEDLPEVQHREAVVRALLAARTEKAEGHRTGAPTWAVDTVVAEELQAKGAELHRFWTCWEGCLEAAGGRSETVMIACAQACLRVLK